MLDLINDRLVEQGSKSVAVVTPMKNVKPAEGMLDGVYRLKDDDQLRSVVVHAEAYHAEPEVYLSFIDLANNQNSQACYSLQRSKMRSGDAGRQFIHLAPDIAKWLSTGILPPDDCVKKTSLTYLTKPRK